MDAPTATTASGGGAARPTVTLNPARIEMELRGSQVQLTVNLFNASDVVEQYTIELTGLEPDWFTAPVASIGLFPQDTDTVQLAIHPPKRPGVKAGSYPFRVIARSRGGAQEHSTEGILDLRGYAVYRINMTPRQQTSSGNGDFKLEIANTGTADTRLHFEGRDAEEAASVKFPRGDEQMATAGSKTEVAVVVQPKKKPWVGPERAYDFNVTVRPVDTRGEPQSVSGQYIHKPRFKSLPIWPILKWVLIALLILVVIAVITAFELPDRFGQRYNVAMSQACASSPLRRVPLVGNMCPAVLSLDNPDRCVFALGFRGVAGMYERLIGRCVTDEVYDRFGNSVQYTTGGVLVWIKETNTVYYFERDNVYAFNEGQIKLIDGSGQPLPPQPN